MTFHEFMLATMALQAGMLLLAAPFGWLVGWYWDDMPRSIRGIFIVTGLPFMVWPMLTQWSGMYLGHPPHWFLALVGAA